MTLDAAEKAGAPVVAYRTDIFENLPNGKLSRLILDADEIKDPAPDWTALVPASALDTARAEIERLRHDNEMLTTGGIVEVAVRNPSVMDYMRHWEGRADKAESALTAAQARIADCERTIEFVQRWAWRETPATDAERLSVIKYHPGIKPADATLSPAVKEPK